MMTSSTCHLQWWENALGSRSVMVTIPFLVHIVEGPLLFESANKWREGEGDQSPSQGLAYLCLFKANKHDSGGSCLRPFYCDCTVAITSSNKKLFASVLLAQDLPAFYQSRTCRFVTMEPETMTPRLFVKQKERKTYDIKAYRYGTTT